MKMKRVLALACPLIYVWVLATFCRFCLGFLSDPNLAWLSGPLFATAILGFAGSIIVATKALFP